MPNLNRLWTMLFPKFLVGFDKFEKGARELGTQMKATRKSWQLVAILKNPY